MRKTLRALKAFIRINVEEMQGIDYIKRLSHCAQICVDEECFMLVETFFKNKGICKAMITYLERTF